MREKTFRLNKNFFNAEPKKEGTECVVGNVIPSREAYSKFLIEVEDEGASKSSSRPKKGQAIPSSSLVELLTLSNASYRILASLNTLIDSFRTEKEEDYDNTADTTPQTKAVNRGLNSLIPWFFDDVAILSEEVTAQLSDPDRRLYQDSLTASFRKLPETEISALPIDKKASYATALQSHGYVLLHILLSILSFILSFFPSFPPPLW